MADEKKVTDKTDSKQGIKIITQQTTDDKAGTPEETEGQNLLGNTNCGIC
jgi:hypothetical protein